MAERIEMGFREFILGTILIRSECIWFAVFRLFWMVQLMTILLRESIVLLMPAQPSSTRRQGPGSLEAAYETSMVHKMVLKVHHKYFNVER